MRTVAGALAALVLLCIPALSASQPVPEDNKWHVGEVSPVNALLCFSSNTVIEKYIPAREAAQKAGLPYIVFRSLPIWASLGCFAPSYPVTFRGPVDGIESVETPSATLVIVAFQLPDGSTAYTAMDVDYLSDLTVEQWRRQSSFPQIYPNYLQPDFYSFRI